MRLFLWRLSAISLLLLSACNFRTGTSETEISPANPTPIPVSPPVAAADQVIERAEPASVSQPSDPEFLLDPAPAPPDESSNSSPEETSAEPISAEGVFDSVVRVLQGAIEGEDDGTTAGSKGSVFGSIGRALNKGFHEAIADEPAKEE